MAKNQPIACSSCGHRRDGGHYNIWTLGENGIDDLKRIFPDAKANEMNFVLFSTSGVHGTYTTIEEIEASLSKYGENPDFTEDEYPDDYCYPEITFAVYHPRLVGIGYGNLRVKLEDIPYLKELRQSSWDAVQTIGKKG